MRPKLILFLFGILTLTILIFNAFHPHSDRPISVNMFDAEDNYIGLIVLETAKHDRSHLTVSMRNVPPGFHGFHIHETGLCEVTEDGDFVTANGHFDMRDSHHGEHSGDLPVLEADESGHVFFTMHTARFHIDDLFDEDGSAFIVHIGADNLANIPERYGGADATTLSNGDAGGRFACGVIAEPK